MDVRVTTMDRQVIRLTVPMRPVVSLIVVVLMMTLTELVTKMRVGGVAKMGKSIMTATVQLMGRWATGRMLFWIMGLMGSLISINRLCLWTQTAMAGTRVILPIKLSAI